MLPQFQKAKSKVFNPLNPSNLSLPPVTPDPKSSFSSSSEDHLPKEFKWLMLVQMGGAILALALELITSSMHALEVVNVTIPMLLMAAGASSVVVHGSPGPYTALSSATTSFVAAFSALFSLLAPLAGMKIIHVDNSQGRNLSFQEAVFAVYTFVCLFEAVISIIIASITYRFSKLSEILNSPMIIYLTTSATDGAAVTTSLHETDFVAEDEKPAVVQLESTECNPLTPNTPSINHSEC